MKFLLFSLMSLILTAFVSVSDVKYADASFGIGSGDEAAVSFDLTADTALERVTATSMDCFNAVGFTDDFIVAVLTNSATAPTLVGGDNDESAVTAMESEASFMLYSI